MPDNPNASHDEMLGIISPHPDPHPANPRPNIFDENLPDSLYNRLGACDFLGKVKEASQILPELFSMDERTLWKWLNSKKMPVTVSDNRLRYKFWTVYDDAVMTDSKMQMSQVFSGVMSYSAFTAFCLEKKEKLAWIMCPPSSYEVSNREALGFSSNMMRELIGVSPIQLDAEGNPTGVVNTKLAELQVKIHAMLDMRVHGGITQRVEQRSLNINMSDDKARKLINQYAETGSIKALESTLENLEEDEAKVLNVPRKRKEKEEKVIDVEPTSSAPKRSNF